MGQEGVLLSYGIALSGRVKYAKWGLTVSLASSQGKVKILDDTYQGYMPQTVEKKEKKYGGIGVVRGLFRGPWVVAGDFNVVRFPLEKKHCNRLNKAMEEFFEFMEDMELQDLSLVGGNFTWRRGDSLDIAARLNRFLIS